MDTMISPAMLHEIVAGRVADMPAHEDRFWALVAGLGVDRNRATRMLDIAVEWINSGRTDDVDPYAVADALLRGSRTNRMDHLA
jgi:hypothetical protein